MHYWGSGYHKQALEKVEIICYYRRIYLPKTMFLWVIYWYHLYLNHLVGGRLQNNIQNLCYWKVCFVQAEITTSPCKLMSTVQKWKRQYGHLTSNNISEPKPCNFVHIYFIVPNTKSIIQYHSDSGILHNDIFLAWMTMLYPTTVWFDTIQVPCFDLNEVLSGNKEYIYKSSDRVIHIFDHTYICRYPCSKKSCLKKDINSKYFFLPC